MRIEECYFYNKDNGGFFIEEKIECVATLYGREDICDCEERFITLSYVSDANFGCDSFDRLNESGIKNGMSLEEIFGEIPNDITDFALK